MNLVGGREGLTRLNVYQGGDRLTNTGLWIVTRGIETYT